MVATIDFYNGFRDRLVNDYHVRNRRVVAALEFATAALDDARDVLDVGCGIGWTSAELADTGATVTGIDISPVLAETAREMFGDRCRFLTGDFINAEIDGRYDAIVMIDVYEHFPRDERPRAHEQIRKLLDGQLVLTVPTPEAMQYARDQGIELQPVDEDVTDQDIERLAVDVGGRIVVNRRVSIWRDGDYRHVLIRVGG